MKPAPPDPDAAEVPRRDTRALLDLAKRADRGIYVHPALWLLIGTWQDLPGSLGHFFWAVTAVFSVNAALRLALRRWFVDLVHQRFHRARTLYFGLLLSNSVQWGALVAGALLWPPLAVAERQLLFAAIALASAGTMGLAIQAFVRLAYPAGILIPTLIALLVNPTSENLLLGLMSALFIAYIYTATQVVHDDYWAAVNAQAALERRADELQSISRTDALTQVGNRLYLNHRLNGEWARAMAESLPLAMLLIDIDRFKSINDTCGHLFGDFCLQAVAVCLRDGLHRRDDLVARYGGEEFAVLLPGADVAAARAVAERLRLRVESLRLQHEGRDIRITCSIGVVSMLPQPGDAVAAALAAADAAMYRAKEGGRNQVVVAA